MTRCRSNSNTITSHIAEKFKMVIKFDSFKEKKNKYLVQLEPDTDL